MPISVSCPSCNTNLKAPDSAAGKTVKCPRCSTPFQVQAAYDPAAYQAPAPQYATPPPREVPDDDDRPRRRRRAPAPQATGLQMGLGIASLVIGALALPFALIPLLGAISWPLGAVGLLIGIAGLIVAMSRQNSGLAFPISGSAVSFVSLSFALVWIFLIHRTVDTAHAALDQGFKDLEGKMKDQMKNFDKGMFDKGGFDKGMFDKGGVDKGMFDKGGIDKGGVGKGGKPLDVSNLPMIGGNGQVNGQLSPRDGKVPWPANPQARQLYGKVYLATLTAGRSYQIDGMSQHFDTYLIVERDVNNPIAFDDDSGGRLNARLVFNPPQTATYRIIIASYNNQLGPFTLTMQQRQK